MSEDWSRKEIKVFSQMIGRLVKIRKDISRCQNNKLHSRFKRYGGYSKFSVEVVYEKLLEELDELFEALKEGSPTDIKDEILDVRNVMEFFWDKVELGKF